MKDNRREFFKVAAIAGIGFAGQGVIPRFADVPAGEVALTAAGPELAPLNRFPRLVQEYFVMRISEIEKAAAQRRAGLKNKRDAQAYVSDVQSKIRQCFGPWPEKTPLNARVTGIIKRDVYNIEKVIFDSRPDFPVTANLYVPTGKKFPLPAVVGTCGHGDPGKATPIYQSYAQGLARQGYVVLIFDPIGQGERLQYLSKEGKPLHGIGVAEHNYVGNQMSLCGEFLGAWFTWDCIRCVDYLLTRPEVDPKYLGVTGNSGGGTQATWLCGVEQRLTMAAPSCFVVGFGRNLRNELPADAEQCPPRVLSLGLDHADFLAAMAPKPVMVLDQEKDYFDARGAEESVIRLKQLYKLLGAEENVQLFIGPEYHGFSKHNREAMYGWFNKATGQGTRQAEPAIITEKEETLWCTPHGQVGEAKPRTVFNFTSERSGALEKSRGTISGEPLKLAVRAVLQMPAISGVPEYRILRPAHNRLYPKKFAVTYAVETEPGMLALVYRLSDEVLLSRPPAGNNKALLYVSHLSADSELREEPFLRELITNEPDAAIYACDVRGIGESRPNTCGDTFLEPYGNDYFYAAHSMMLDYPYIGQKTFDLLRILNWMASVGHTQVHLVAKGWGTTPATFAGLLSDTVTQVSLKNALTSYSDVAESEAYNWPLSTLLPGVLKKFDLPDCYRALNAKKLRQVDPVNAMAQVV